MHANYNNNNLKLEPIHLLYDERMLLHRPIGWVEPDVFPENIDDCDDDYPMENPERLRVIYDRLCSVEDRLVVELEEEGDCGEQTVFKPLRCAMATKEQILLAHSEAQYEHLDKLQYYSNEELTAMSLERRHDIYYCRETFQAARLAAGGLLACVDAVFDSETKQMHPTDTTSNSAIKTNKALALVRPPGHHACQSQEMGFCFIDSVVVAAKYAISQKKAKRVAILDWDIHDELGLSSTLTP